MAIGNVIQRGHAAHVYDERGRHIGTIGISGHQPDDGLKGYTSSTVNIRNGNIIYTYDERGLKLAARPAR